MSKITELRNQKNRIEMELEISVGLARDSFNAKLADAFHLQEWKPKGDIINEIKIIKDVVLTPKLPQGCVNVTLGDLEVAIRAVKHSTEWEAPRFYGRINIRVSNALLAVIQFNGANPDTVWVQLVGGGRHLEYDEMCEHFGNGSLDELVVNTLTDLISNQRLVMPEIQNFISKTRGKTPC